MVSVEGNTAAPTDTLTEKGAPSYSTSGVKRLDLFYSALVRGCTEDKLFPSIEASWAESAENTVQLFLHARDCRGGKGEKQVVYSCLKWLRQHKPRTYRLNLARFLECGYYKDLLQIASLVIKNDMPPMGDGEILELELFCQQLREDIQALDEFEKARAAGVDPEAKAAEAMTDDSEGKIDERPKEKPQAADGGVGDDSVEGKMEDEPAQNPRKRRRKQAVSLSLAGKWAPSEKTHFDKAEAGRLAKRMRQLMYPTDKHDAEKYRKMLTRLRTHLKVVEQLVCANRWDQIQFGKVPSRAHKMYRNAFKKHDKERYEQYLEDVKSGKATIKVAGIQPHELVDHYYKQAHAPVLDETIEMQWKALVERVCGGGKFDSAVAVVDVSGSMTCNESIPLRVAIALGLLTAQATKEPFQGHVITFSTNPRLHRVKGDTLMDQFSDISRMDWGGSTNVQKVFDVILAHAVAHNVPQDDMPKILFIFSDMQFDYADAHGSTNYQSAQRKFERAGYTCPQMVFWNLAARISTVPVKSEQPGVSLISGFSGELLKLFIAGGEINPLELMMRAIEPYKVEIHPDER